MNLNDIELQKVTVEDFQKLLERDMTSEVKEDLNSLSLLELMELYFTKYDTAKSSHYNNTILKTFSAFQDTVKTVFMATDLTATILQFYIKYLFDINHSAPKSINNYIYKINRCMRFGAENGLMIKFYDYNHVKILNYSIDQLVLNKDVISMIYHYPLSFAANDYTQHTLECIAKARDAFILQCNLGLEYDSLITINKNNFIEYDSVLQMVDSKGHHITNDLEKLTFNYNMTKTLLEKYDYKCPIIREKYNYYDYIKELGKIVFGEKTFNKMYHIDKTTIYKECLISEFFDAKIARRSFCYYNRNRTDGLANEMNLLKATGYKDSSYIDRYLKDTVEIDIYNNKLKI